MRYLGFALLIAGFVTGCGGGTTDPDAGDAGNGGRDGSTMDAAANGNNDDSGTNDDAGEEDGGTTGEDAGDSGKDDGGKDPKPDADAGKVEVTCADEEIECGELPGQDCSDPDENDFGVEKTCPDYATCEENKCTCTPEAAEVGDNGLECGQINNCTEEGLDFGNCDSDDYVGENWFCSDERKCECTPKTKVQACGESTCGMVGDGCGGTISCSDSDDGGCELAEECVDDDGVKTCTCDADFDASSLAFCGGKCGIKSLPTELACQVDCGDSCGPCQGPAPVRCDGGGGTDGECVCGAEDGGSTCGNQGVCCDETPLATLCSQQGATCGEQVTDPCTGSVRTCGCGGGKACLLGRFRTGSNENVCVDEDVANFAGKYIVRTHTFGEDDAGGGSVTRSEAVSLVTVSFDTSDSSFDMLDVGCVASNRVFNGNRSFAEAYWRIPSVQRDLQVNLGNGTWERRFSTHPDGDSKRGTPTGWDNVACSVGPRSWLPNGQNCSCEGVDDSCVGGDITPACMPVEDNSRSADCRINDVDENGRPGFTLRFEGGLGNRTRLDVATVADIRWSGAIRPDGQHTGLAQEPDPLLRSVVGCSDNNAACGSAASVNGGSCGQEFNRIQWVKLNPGEFDLACDTFYTDAVDLDGETDDESDDIVTEFSDIRQNLIDDRFKAIGPDCSGGGACPDGMICQDDACWPMTTEGACDADEDCGEGWECRGNGCWPELEISVFIFIESASCGVF